MTEPCEHVPFGPEIAWVVEETTERTVWAGAVVCRLCGAVYAGRFERTDVDPGEPEVIRDRDYVGPFLGTQGGA